MTGPLLSGLIGGLLAAAFMRWAGRRDSRAVRRPDGWWELKPHWAAHILVLGCALLAALPASHYIAYGVPDEQGEAIALALIFAGFAGGTLYLVAYFYGQQVLWHGREIQVRRIGRDDRLFDLTGAINVIEKPGRGEIRLEFADGGRLTLSTLLSGTSELAERALSAARNNLRDIKSSPGI